MEEVTEEVSASDALRDELLEVKQQVNEIHAFIMGLKEAMESHPMASMLLS